MRRSGSRPGSVVRDRCFCGNGALFRRDQGCCVVGLDPAMGNVRQHRLRAGFADSGKKRERTELRLVFEGRRDGHPGGAACDKGGHERRENLYRHRLARHLRLLLQQSDRHGAQGKHDLLLHLPGQRGGQPAGEIHHEKLFELSDAVFRRPADRGFQRPEGFHRRHPRKQNGFEHRREKRRVQLEHHAEHRPEKPSGSQLRAFRGRPDQQERRRARRRERDGICRLPASVGPQVPAGRDDDRQPRRHQQELFVPFQQPQLFHRGNQPLARGKRILLHLRERAVRRAEHQQLQLRRP